MVEDPFNDGHAGDVDVPREHDHPQHGGPPDLIPREEEEISCRAQLPLPRLISGHLTVSCKSRTLNMLCESERRKGEKSNFLSINKFFAQRPELSSLSQHSAAWSVCPSQVLFLHPPCFKLTISHWRSTTSSSWALSGLVSLPLLDTEPSSSSPQDHHLGHIQTDPNQNMIQIL